VHRALTQRGKGKGRREDKKGFNLTELLLLLLLLSGYWISAPVLICIVLLHICFVLSV
jgi:hypothetical protein